MLPKRHSRYLSMLLGLFSGDAGAKNHFMAFGSYLSNELDVLKEVDFATHPPSGFRPNFKGRTKEARLLREEGVR